MHRFIIPLLLLALCVSVTAAEMTPPKDTVKGFLNALKGTAGAQQRIADFLYSQDESYQDFVSIPILVGYSILDTRTERNKFGHYHYYVRVGLPGVMNVDTYIMILRQGDSKKWTVYAFRSLDRIDKEIQKLRREEEICKNRIELAERDLKVYNPGIIDVIGKTHLDTIAENKKQIEEIRFRIAHLHLLRGKENEALSLFEEYLKKYPSGRFEKQAKIYLGNLK